MAISGPSHARRAVKTSPTAENDNYQRLRFMSAGLPWAVLTEFGLPAVYIYRASPSASNPRSEDMVKLLCSAILEKSEEFSLKI